MLLLHIVAHILRGQAGRFLRRHALNVLFQQLEPRPRNQQPLVRVFLWFFFSFPGQSQRVILHKARYIDDQLAIEGLHGGFGHATFIELHKNDFIAFFHGVNHVGFFKKRLHVYAAHVRAVMNN